MLPLPFLITGGLLIVLGLGLWQGLRGRAARLRDLPGRTGQPVTLVLEVRCDQPLQTPLRPSAALVLELQLKARLGSDEEREVGRTQRRAEATFLLEGSPMLLEQAAAVELPTGREERQELPPEAVVRSSNGYIVEGHEIPADPVSAEISGWVLSQRSLPHQPWVTARGVLAAEGVLGAPLQLGTRPPGEQPAYGGLALAGLGALVLALGLFLPGAPAVVRGDSIESSAARWELEGAALGTPREEALEALGPDAITENRYHHYSPTRGWGFSDDGTRVEVLWACARAFQATDGQPTVAPSARPYRGALGPGWDWQQSLGAILGQLGPPHAPDTIGDLSRYLWPGDDGQPSVAAWVLPAEPDLVACWEIRAP